MSLTAPPPRLVETIDEHGRPGPALAVMEAHRTATAHRAISIVVWNPTRTKMLVTRRAATKTTWPGFWSNAVCSHPLPKEADATAARRRLGEELRIERDVKLAFTMRYGPVQCPVSGVYEHEFDHVFDTTLPETLVINPDPTEISALRWVDRDTLTSMRRANEITPWFALILERVGWLHR